MLIPAQTKLLFIGDSITDAGRSPSGEGLFDALGKGYVAQVDGFLSAVYPERKIRIINKGSSGNTVRDLSHRWQTDVLDYDPSWLSVMIGINDVWRQFDSPLDPSAGVPPEEYEGKLNDLLSQTRSKLDGLVLMSPFMIEVLGNDLMRARMDSYGAIVRRLAQKHHAIFVDVQAAFDKILVHIHSSNLAWDRIHPNQTGTAVIAKAFLDAIEFSWNGESYA